MLEVFPLHIRVWRFPLEGASSLEVLNVVLYIRSSSKKRGKNTWLNACTVRTTSLCLARINVSELSSSVMDTDRMMKAVKKLLLTMQKSSNYAEIQQQAAQSPKDEP